MITTIRTNRLLVCLFLAIAGAFSTASSVAQSSAPVTTGQRVFTAGHSFHAWIQPWLQDVADSAGIKGHESLGSSMIGGSKVIQHWDIPDDKNKVKEALRTGKVDVLTLSPMWKPDDGIEKFATLALEKNPNTRITVQEFWLPYDKLRGYGDLEKSLRPWEDPAPLEDSKKEVVNVAHFNVPTIDQLRKLHEPYFQTMDEYVVNLNKKLGKQAVLVVPMGQAMLALRERVIAGKVPGIEKQSDLFIDKLGHPKPFIKAMSAYCHFSVIYHRSPVGLPAPNQHELRGKLSDDLNHLLQEIAWDAVTHHPLSGVTADNVPARGASAAK